MPSPRVAVPLTLVALCGVGHARPQAYPDLPLGPPAPLPVERAVEDAMAEGDRRWMESLAAAPGDRAGLVRAAFDLWQGALELGGPGAGVRVVLPGLSGSPFAPEGAWDPSRAAEGVQDGVIRRLFGLDPDLASGWAERFAPRARLALAEALAATPDRAGAALAAVDRHYPLTGAAAAAALASADLALEEGRPEVAARWLMGARRQLAVLAAWVGRGLPADVDPDRLGRAVERRAQAVAEALSRPRGHDHTALHPALPWGAPAPAEVPELHLMHTERIVGLARSAVDPFGRGLPSGLAILEDGTVLVQAAPGLMLLEPFTDAGAHTVTRARTGEALGIGRLIVRAAASAGGWASLPATDGQHVALVAGRAEGPRTFLDVEIPPTGNALAVVVRGGKDRPIRPLWVLRDGKLLRRPAEASGGLPRDLLAPLGAAEEVPGWDLGLGWEWQPGPVLAGGVVYALARCLGDSDGGGPARADQVRLFAVDLATAAVLWSREVTSERGRAEDRARGDAGFFAVSTMPLGVERTSGTLIVGTNAGLLLAFGAAEGRLLWAVRTQREGDGWPGSQPPLVVPGISGAAGPSAWVAPLGSESLYAVHAGPWPLGAESPFAEPPRARRGALSLAAVHPPAAPGGRSTVVLLGPDGRHDAALLDAPGEPRIPTTYLAPAERFGGHAAVTPHGLVVSGTEELVALSRASGYGIARAAPIPSKGAGRGGDVVAWRDRVYVVGRDTLWIYEAR